LNFPTALTDWLATVPPGGGDDTHVQRESPVVTVHVYGTPSRSTPAGTVHDIGPLAGAVNHPEDTTCPDAPSAPVATFTQYLTVSPSASVTVGHVNVGVNAPNTVPVAGVVNDGCGGAVFVTVNDLTQLGTVLFAEMKSYVYTCQ
jgi:hypothetical protein